MPVSNQAYIWGTMVEHVGVSFVLLMASRAAGVDDGFARPLSNCAGGEKVEPRLEGKPVLREGSISIPVRSPSGGLFGNGL